MLLLAPFPKRRGQDGPPANGSRLSTAMVFTAETADED